MLKSSLNNRKEERGKMKFDSKAIYLLRSTERARKRDKQTDSIYLCTISASTMMFGEVTVIAKWRPEPVIHRRYKPRDIAMVCWGIMTAYIVINIYIRYIWYNNIERTKYFHLKCPYTFLVCVFFLCVCTYKHDRCHCWLLCKLYC